MRPISRLGSAIRPAAWFCLWLLVLTGCALPLPGVEPTAPPTASPTTPTPTPAPAENAAGTPLPPTAESSPTPFAPVLRQLTEAGCCVQPFWSADGQTVLFIDQPQPTAPTGIYGVPVDGGEETLISERIALPSPDGRYRAYLNSDGDTVVEPVDSSVQWIMPNDGLRVFFSPNSARLAWAETPQTGGDFDKLPTTITIADIDGSDAKELTTVYGGGIAGWLDDDHLLLSGRDKVGSQDITLFSLSVMDGARFDLITNQRITTVRIAPGGQWIMYTIALHPDDSSNDGLWVIKADASQRYKLEVVGAAQWRDASHLLIIPLELDAPSHRLWQFDAQTGQAVAITDPALTPFRILAGDWSVSPTGEYVVFVSEADQALWVIPLPPFF